MNDTTTSAPSALVLAARAARLEKARVTYERAIAASYIEASAIITGMVAIGVTLMVGLGLI